MAKSRNGAAWLVPTVLLLVVLPVGFAAHTAVRGGGSDPRAAPPLSRAGSDVVDDSPSGGWTFGQEPVTYELTYRVERYDPDRIQVSEDRVVIRRPFDGRIRSFVAGRLTGDRASRFGALVLTTGEGPRTLVSPAAPATGDLRLATSLPDAVAEGWAAERERRMVLGVECQVYRVGSSVSAGQLTPVGTQRGEHSDLCVDAQGLLLEEVWFQEGKPLQRRVATHREIGAPLDDERFRLAADEPAFTSDDGNGFIRAVDPASAFEGTVYRLTRAPEGATYGGRFVVQPPTFSPFRSALEAPSERREQVSLVDVWERGADVLVFSITIAADISAVPNDARTAQRFRLGPVGEAATVVDLRSNEVRVELPEARFLRIAGTFPRQELVDLAGSLRAEVGTGVVFLDP